MSSQRIRELMDRVAAGKTHFSAAIKTALQTGRRALSQETTTNAVSDITQNLGDQRAGRFLAFSAGSEPEDGTGVGMEADGHDFGDGVKQNLYGIEQGKMKWGASNEDGSLTWGSGAGKMSDRGLDMTGLRYAFQQTAQNAGNTRIGTLEMLLYDQDTIPDWGMTYSDAPGPELVSGGDFESGLTGWTKTTETGGLWDVETIDPLAGTSSLKWTASASGCTGVITNNTRIAVDPLKVLRFTLLYRFTVQVGAGTQPVMAVTYYDDPTAGSSLGTHYLTTDNKVLPTTLTRLAYPPKAAKSAVISVQLPGVTFTAGESMLFDNISVVAVSLAHILYFSDGGLYFNGRQLVPQGAALPVLAQFSLWNAAAALGYSDTTAGIRLALNTPAAGNAMRGISRSVPATPYTLTACFSHQLFTIATQTCGLFIQGSTGIATLELMSNATSINVRSTKRATYTGAPTAYFTHPVQSYNPIWLRITDNGSFRATYWSTDGTNWIVSNSVASTDFIGTPSSIGFFVEVNNATYPVAATLMGWTIS